ncbi:armadillo-type protein [Suillus cothurnatus]|nr:armadillo-type protein [Suillus cothurnatus]
MNLVHTPQVADTILSNEIFTNYDRPRIANLCEKAGLLQRVTSVHHEGLADIKHAIFHTSGLQPESMSCMQDMLRVNIRQKLQVVIQIATKHSDILGSVKLIEMFEYFKTFEGDFHRMPLLYYPSSIVNISEDPEATTRTGQICEAERIYRESNHYKNFLKGAKLPDQLPLIIVYDRFDFVHDLVLYLYQNKLTKFIEVYVQRVNSVRMSQVVGVEQPNRLKLILPWLEDPAVFNALAKIFIDSNNKPETFLKKNNLYEPLVVGNFCEARDLYLAYITYAKGFCDDELIDIINDNSIFKQAASSPELRAQVLFHDNIHHRALIDQIVATALPECTDLDDVSVTVKAFLLVDLPIEVIKLREKVVIEPSPFNKGKVVGFINKLQNHEAGEIAKIATDHGLYEQALTIYKKYDQLAMASAQLDGLRIKDVVDSYIKAEDECPSNFAGAIEISSHAAKHDDLADRLHAMEDFLTMINVADILQVGQKCFEYELYQAAKLLPTSISNWSHNAALAMIEHFWEHAPRQEMIQERRGSPRPNEADSV